MARKRLALGALAACYLSASASAADLTIATFNTEFLTRPKVHVKFGLNLDLKRESQAIQQQWADDAFRDEKFAEAAAAVASVIVQLEAEVLALTEAGDEADVEELRQAVAAAGIQYGHAAVCECTDSFTQQHVAVLSKFPLRDVLRAIQGKDGYYEELDDPESENDTGISKGMRVTFDAAGHEFILYVVHLASERGGHEQDMQRVAQASIVRRHSLPLLNEDRNVIVAGDFNDYRGQPAIRRVRGLDDIWPDLIQTGAVEYFDKDKLGTRWTYEFQGERNQIDHVLLSQSIKDLAKRSGIRASVLDHGNPLASDHRPLVVQLELR